MPPTSFTIVQHRKGAPLPWSLLLDADPSRREVRRYLKRGELWLAKSGSSTLGAMVLMQTRSGVLEIMNIATAPSHRGKGIGLKLLAHARTRARQLGLQTLEVGTGNNSFLQLQFYQRFGFRITGVDRDFFVKRYDRSYRFSGITLRDMVRMELKV